ncbi:MAG: ABC transporter ATP-binding protein, partial [Alphaproteobacteria bacterium]|nr:ABC transporter ATP-binding protein [Alphaproteobacteria bacterium]
FPVQIDAVENIGRFKIVRANLQGHAINALLKEHENVPADPTLNFETARINVYENSHLVRAGA